MTTQSCLPRVLATPLAILLVIACTTESERAVTGLSESQLSEYNATIEELEQKTGVDVLAPTYLPPGTEWKPDIEPGFNKNEAVMTFYRANLDTPVWARPVIRIAQAQDPDQRICPPCDDLADVDLERTEYRGATLFTDILPHTDADRVSAAIYFRSGELRVEASFDWDSSSYTDEMENEALKVIESMLIQAIPEASQ